MNNAMPAPVAFFAFKRPEHTSRTLAALAANDLAADTDLYIFCDGPRSSTDEEAVEQVRTLCRNAKGFASVHVHEHSANQGLANSLTAGLDSMFEKHDRVIVFEDDVLASPGTLRFLNASLERYQSQPVVFSICAWSPDPQKMGFPEDYPWDVYFTPRFNCWGWASWRDRWQSVDRTLSTAPALFENPYALRGYSQGGADLPHMLQHVLDGKLSTWDVQTDFARFTQGRLGLSPLYSFTDNIGHDSSGTNCSGDAPHFVVDVSLAPSVVRFPEFIFVDEILGGKYRDFHSGNLPMPAGAISLAHIEKVEQELAYCQNSKVAQGVLQLRGIVKRRSWWELFGWSWRVVRFVARKLLGRAKRALTGGLFDAGNAVPVTSDPGAAFGAENASRNEEQLSTLSTLPNDEHLCGESSDLLKQFQQNGSKPWASGYHEYKWETLAKYIQADFSAIVGTEKYGYRIDERAVELPWLLSRLDNNPGVMLDAGSALNFPVILQHPKICSKKLFISTLACEGSAWPELGISYVYEDLRHTSFQENFFDSIACISTIEHIGMDNTFLYTADTSKKEQNIEDYLSFLDVMHSRLKPGGRLYLSFPFGKACNHSWLQIFDAAMTDRLIARFQPTTCLETIFYYSNDCWHLSSRKEAREAAYFDINVQKEYESDFLAAARSVACLELVK